MPKSLSAAAKVIDEKNLAARFRACCLRKGWDIGELARHAGVSRTTLYHLERGMIRRPRISTLCKIAEALEVTPEQLWGTDELPDDNPSEPQAKTSTSSPSLQIVRSPRRKTNSNNNSDWQRDFDRSTNCVVTEVYQESPELFAGWTDDEWDELYSTFGTGGPLTAEGVADATNRMNQKRETVRKLQIVLDTHLGDVAAKLIATLYQMVRPQRR